MRNKIIIGLLILLIIPIATALMYEKESVIDLKLPCFNNGTFCSGTATCNLTVLYPNYSIVVDKIAMENQGTYHNYTLNSSQTLTVGEHSVIASCTDGAYSGSSTFNYDITPTGQEISSSQGLVSIGLIMSIIFLSFIFCFYGHKFSESPKLFPIALFFMCISLFLGVYTLHMGYIFTRDILFPLSGEGVQFKMYIGIMWGLLAVAFIGMLSLLRKTLMDFKKAATIKKHGEGYNPDTKQYK